MLTKIDGFNPDVIGVRAEGVVKGADYREVLSPAVDRALDKGIRPRLLYVISREWWKISMDGATWMRSGNIYVL